MKQLKLTFLLIVLMSMVGAKASAHDIEVKNADGVTIYYTYMNNETELAVSYRGSGWYEYSNEYSGVVNIPESVTYNGTIYPVTSIGKYAFYYCSGLTSVTIGNSVTSIGNFAFEGCIGLTSVTIPNSVTSIGRQAFDGCSGLTSVTIPNSVTSIGNWAFDGCSGLTEINVDENNSTYSSIDGVVFNKSQTELVCYPGGKQGAYTIPNSVTTIGSSAFWECHGLTSVTIPNSVTSIGDYAFIGCSSLTSVTIGNSVTNLGDYAFAGCTNITKLTSCATTPPICGTQALNDINKWDCTLVVPVGSKSAYQAADQWKDFFLIEESDVTAINRIYDDEAEGRIVGIYDLNGRKLERLQRGMNIVRMSDGTSKKVVVK